MENDAVPLSKIWTDFLAMPQNNTDLACFLLKHLIVNAPTDKLLVVSGGFKRKDEVQTSGHGLNIEQLEANHEEACPPLSTCKCLVHCYVSTGHRCIGVTVGTF